MGRPRKNVKVITGQKPVEDRDLDEILTGKKASKFGRFTTRAEYEEYLQKLDHTELCEELLRLGDTPSVEPKLCLERCIRKYDAAQKPRVRQQQPLGKVRGKSLEEIIRS